MKKQFREKEIHSYYEKCKFKLYCYHFHLFELHRSKSLIIHYVKVQGNRYSNTLLVRR